MTVLVVDDSPDIRFMLRMLLEEEGMEVEEADGGAPALRRLTADGPAPDAVVLDQRMPDLTGIEVARELAGREHPPLVLFSAYLHPDLHEEARRLGMATITKTEIGELLEHLRGTVPAAA
jgi:CheY-like chemotaxis protein